MKLESKEDKLSPFQRSINTIRIRIDDLRDQLFSLRDGVTKNSTHISYEAGCTILGRYSSLHDGLDKLESEINGLQWWHSSESKEEKNV